MKPLVLFDMDGTLTPARKPIDRSTVVKLRELQQHADIGIVSGSPYIYIEQQMGMAWREINSLIPADLVIMPCNGTQIYQFASVDGKPTFTQTYSSSMIEYVSHNVYRVLLSILTDLQNQVIEDYSSLPLSGNFISFRESMVNWCMIGRDANHNMRNIFTDMDIKFSIRNKLKERLNSELHVAGIDNIITSLGGSTSIDIYPKGWDKTYCLRHVDDDRLIYFIGDKCHGDGNDRALFEHTKTKAYETSGPSKTLLIIDDILSDICNG